MLMLPLLQADLADRDFTAERYQPIVVGSSAHSALAAEQSVAARAEAESRAGRCPQQQPQRGANPLTACMSVSLLRRRYRWGFRQQVALGALFGLYVFICGLQQQLQRLLASMEAITARATCKATRSISTDSPAPSLALTDCPPTPALSPVSLHTAHKLVIPRRPAWDESTTPDQLDAQEKAAFLSWRRCGSCPGVSGVDRPLAALAGSSSSRAHLRTAETQLKPFAMGGLLEVPAWQSQQLEQRLCAHRCGPSPCLSGVCGT